MTLTLEISPALESELTRQASARGIGVDAYATDLLSNAAHVPSALGAAGEAPARPSQEVLDAIDRLHNFGKKHGLSLGGMTIRELRDEARP